MKDLLFDKQHSITLLAYTDRTKPLILKYEFRIMFGYWKGVREIAALVFDIPAIELKAFTPASGEEYIIHKPKGSLEYFLIKTATWEVEENFEDVEILGASPDVDNYSSIHTDTGVINFRLT